MSKLEVSKEFRCSKEKLYRAWTEQDQLKQWWKPMGKQLIAVENDLAEGGTVKYQFNDNTLLIDGNYEKVVPNELLEYTWNWHVSAEPIKDAAYKLSVRFEGDESNATISITQDGFLNEENIHPHQHGWEEGLEQLKSYVESQGEMQSNAGTLNEQLVDSGYNEDPEQVKVGGG